MIELSIPVVKLDSKKQKLPLEKLSPMEGLTYLTPVHIQQQMMPVLIPKDMTSTEKTETILEGETIACFIVGGEKRLCLPQILNTVLRDFNLQEINTVCDDLHIFCSRCSAEQLETLKVTRVLPPSAPSCGLITKTDAERLCNALLHREPEKSKGRTPNSFKVYHECFGKCKGIFNPELYTSPHAKCIECTECRGLLSPQKFVCHSHKALENRTCHWGFDSANWRAYLLLAKDQEFRDRAQRELDGMKARFDYMSRYKRKDEQGDESEYDPKRARYDESGSAKYEAGQSMSTEGGQYSIPRPVPSYLQTGPPVLLNPERVVPFSEKFSRDRHFAPNVSLAPQTQVKEEKEEKCTTRCSMGEEDVKPPPDLMLSSSSSSSSETCTPSPTKTSQHEVSDAEESFKSDSVPSTPREERLAALVSQPSHVRSREIDMLKLALDGKVPDSREAKDKFIQEFMCLRLQDEENIKCLTSSRREIAQELEYIKLTNAEKLHEAEESKKELRKEIDRLRLEQDKLIQQQIDDLRTEHNDMIQRLQEENVKLRKEIEAIKSLQEIDVEKLDHDDDFNMDDQRCRDLARLRQELKRSGVGEAPLPPLSSCNNGHGDGGAPGGEDTDQTDTAEEENAEDDAIKTINCS